jgi:hypothetical protein
MENDENRQSPAPTEPKELESAPNAELVDAALEDVSGGQRSYRFDTGADLKPAKKRQSGVLAPRED